VDHSPDAAFLASARKENYTAAMYKRVYNQLARVNNRMSKHRWFVERSDGRRFM
jgi:hypothetical protein